MKHNLNLKVPRFVDNNGNKETAVFVLTEMGSRQTLSLNGKKRFLQSAPLLVTLCHNNGVVSHFSTRATRHGKRKELTQNTATLYNSYMTRGLFRSFSVT
jgi:hypothetical protein